MAFKIMQWFDNVGQVISDTLEKKQRSETELLLRQRWGKRLSSAHQASADNFLGFFQNQQDVDDVACFQIQSILPRRGGYTGFQASASRILEARASKAAFPSRSLGTSKPRAWE